MKTISLKSLVLIVLLGVVSLAPVRAAEGKLRFYWTDVEGGAATLIVTPAGESILIDTAMPGGRDPGRIFKTASEVAKVKQIDYLITSHMHIDHFGGAAELSQLIPIKQVYDNGIPEENPDGNRADRTWVHTIKPYREFAAEKRHVIAPGTVIPLKSTGSVPIKLYCVAAKQKFIAPPAGAKTNDLCAMAKEKGPDTSDNANSIVMVLEYGGFRYFAGGDLTWNLEAKLVCPHDLVGKVDVYQVNHHGMDSSNNPLLVRTLAPTVAVMSNGTSKGCGAETFATLKGTPSLQAIYQIHRNLRPDSENNTAPEFIANLEAKCAAHHIELAVDADGKNYEVSIPGNGHKKSYATGKK